MLIMITGESNIFTSVLKCVFLPLSLFLSFSQSVYAIRTTGDSRRDGKHDFSILRIKNSTFDIAYKGK